MHLPRLVLVVPAAFMGLLVTPVSLLAQAKLEATVIAPQGAMVSNPSMATFSRTGLHALVTSPKGSRQVCLFDGVEGPRFDRLSDPSHKIVSSDGKRHAYTAFVGTDVILVVDGKEIARAPANGSLSPFPSPGFGFSPSGKRFWYVTPAETGGIHKLVVDGVASDPTNGIDAGSFVWSQDESRYAVLYLKQDDRRGPLLMVDGKSVGFQGGKPQFSPDGKNVITIGRAPDTDVLLINGKPASRAPVIHNAYMSSGGLSFLVIGTSRNAQGVFLGAGGKKIPGSDCDSIDKVIFSPDGKRYAALCTVGGSKKYVLIDGKKGQLYDQVEELQFTADSAKALYLARSFSAGGQFLVVEEDESDGYQSILLALGAGKRIGYVAQVMGQANATVVVDGKATLARGASYFGFSPDGSRYAFSGFAGGFLSLYLDGEEQKGIVVYDNNLNDGNNSLRVRFSPDGKHVACFGSVNGDTSKRGLVVDGKLVDVTVNGIYSLPFFTPDSNHLVHFRFIPGGGYEVLVDGKSVDKVTSFPTSLPAPPPVGPATGLPVSVQPFEMGSDGVFTFVGITDGAAKRYRIAPDGSTSLASLLAGAAKSR